MLREEQLKVQFVYTGMMERHRSRAIDKSSFAILAQHHLVSYLYHRHLSYMPLMIERKSWYLDGTDEVNWHITKPNIEIKYGKRIPPTSYFNAGRMK
jgi:hypothetical protein